MFVFVGSYRRKVSAAGVLRLPKDWLPGMGCSGRIYFMRDKSSDRNCLVPEMEFAGCGKAMQKGAAELEIDASGSILLGSGLARFVPWGSRVVLRGCIRYIEICVRRDGAPAAF
jgi:hypothetical protein